MEEIINIRSLFKKLWGFQSSFDVSLDIEKGTIFGLLGPNGRVNPR